MLARTVGAPSAAGRVSDRRPHLLDRHPPPGRSPLLALQRLAGNATVGALLEPHRGAARARGPSTVRVVPADARTRPVVQRRPWLDDPDACIYRERGLDLKLAFIGTISGRENVGLFMDHARTPALWDWYGDWAVPPRADWITTSKDRREALEKVVGTLWHEAGGTLVSSTKFAGNTAVVRALIIAGAVGGYRHRREGGGSRLPAAEGVLYFDARVYTNRREALIRGCGVPAEKVAEYGGVVGAPVPGPAAQTMSEATRHAQRSGELFRSGSGFVYVSSVTARPRPDRLVTAAGRAYPLDFSGLSAEDQRTLEESFAALRAPTSTGWVDDLTGGRDGSQSEAMGKWNALAAAAFYNAKEGGSLPMNHNWEWLHVRGAQIGGGTDAGNLVPGTFAANSAMIPYEAQIKKWHVGNHGKIKARFSTRQVKGIIADRIVIEVATTQHPALGRIPESEPLRVEFDPIGRVVVDKLMGRLTGKAWRDEAQVRGSHPSIGELVAMGPPPVLAPVDPGDEVTMMVDLPVLSLLPLVDQLGGGHHFLDALLSSPALAHGSFTVFDGDHRVFGDTDLRDTDRRREIGATIDLARTGEGKRSLVLDPDDQDGPPKKKKKTERTVDLSALRFVAQVRVPRRRDGRPLTPSGPGFPFLPPGQ